MVLLELIYLLKEKDRKLDSYLLWMNCAKKQMDI